MAADREIKRRIRSVKNIAKVTAPWRRFRRLKCFTAQSQVEATRPYANKAWEVMTFLARLRQSQADLQPLLQERPVKTICLLLMTTNHGLAGGLNSVVISHAWKHIQQWQDEGKQVTIVTVGHKGRDWMARYGSPSGPRLSTWVPADQRRITRASEARATGADINSIAPITRVGVDDFTSRDCDAVYLAYTDYRSVLRQTPIVRQFLPIHPSDPTAPMAPDYIFEPDAQTVLSQVLYNVTKLQILQSLYKSIASEHAARMVAMRNATDAANDLIADLSLRYNKARQEKITKELLDIAAGANALA